MQYNGYPWNSGRPIGSTLFIYRKVLVGLCPVATPRRLKRIWNASNDQHVAIIIISCGHWSPEISMF